MWISYPETAAATTGHSGPCGSLTLWPRRQPPATPVHVDLLPCDHGGNHRPLRSMWISYPVTTAATTGHSGPCGSLTLWPRRQPPATPVHVDLLPCDHGGNHRPPPVHVDLLPCGHDGNHRQCSALTLALICNWPSLRRHLVVLADALLASHRSPHRVLVVCNQMRSIYIDSGTRKGA